MALPLAAHGLFGPQPAIAVAVYGSAVTTFAHGNAWSVSVSCTPKRFHRCLLCRSSALIGSAGRTTILPYNRGFSGSDRADELLWSHAAEDRTRRLCLNCSRCSVFSRPTRALVSAPVPQLDDRAELPRSRRTFRTGGKAPLGTGD